MNQIDLFAKSAKRINMRESINLSQQSMLAHAPNHDHWVIAWSGGKDSTATLTVIAWMIESGMIPAPKRLTVLYADTRMEIPPLAIAAEHIMDELIERGIDVHRVLAPMDKRFLVYMLGRGVPPPNNQTLRWCTAGIKITPMIDKLVEIASGEKILMITGVRQGESAIRDRRIEMSCSKDGAECGQGWYQADVPNNKKLQGKISALAPLLHWRVCHVWEWLRHWAPGIEFGDWSTQIIADAYGGDEAEEINARTGCIACPLASEDTALNTVIKMSHWVHLKPLLRLRPIYRELRKPEHRIRKTAETLKSGKLSSNPQRMGPLKMESRRWALNEILTIQTEVNHLARASNRPAFDILNADEVARIHELIESNTWPNGWTGDEQGGDVPLSEMVYSDGAVQTSIFGLGGVQ